MDRIDVMRMFIRVADSGNFSKTARATGVSQPTVSKLIAGLEARLGVQLLRRTSRGLSLTDAGQISTTPQVPSWKVWMTSRRELAKKRRRRLA